MLLILATVARYLIFENDVQYKLVNTFSPLSHLRISEKMIFYINVFCLRISYERSILHKGRIIHVYHMRGIFHMRSLFQMRDVFHMRDNL